MATNVRAEAKKLWNNASEHDRFINFKHLMRDFKRQLEEFGVLGELNQRRYYEGESRRKRRKSKEAQRSRSGHQRG